MRVITMLDKFAYCMFTDYLLFAGHHSRKKDREIKKCLFSKEA